MHYFRVIPDSPIPIFEQIVTQVIYGVASGTLEAGMLIPSVRELAVELTVHPNTVAKAYQELERRNVLVARRGRGMEVTADAPGICKTKRQEIVRNRIRQALKEAVQSELPAADVEKLVTEELHRFNGHRE